MTYCSRMLWSWWEHCCLLSACTGALLWKIRKQRWCEWELLLVQLGWESSSTCFCLGWRCFKKHVHEKEGGKLGQNNARERMRRTWRSKVKEEVGGGCQVHEDRFTRVRPQTWSSLISDLHIVPAHCTSVASGLSWLIKPHSRPLPLPHSSHKVNIMVIIWTLITLFRDDKPEDAKIEERSDLWCFSSLS